MFVLGLDPSSTCTGWGVVEFTKGSFVDVEHGTIRPAGGTFERRIQDLFTRLDIIFRSFSLHIDHVAAEAPVVFGHGRIGGRAASSQKVGVAYGACLAAAAANGHHVVSYKPSEIKAAVCHHGAASKEHVAISVRAILGLKKTPVHDAADALAVAILHAGRRHAIR